MLVRLAVAGFLLAHAVIHVSFLAPAPPATAAASPAWPFTMTHSWLFIRLDVAPEAARSVGTALVATTIAGFALAALCAIGIVPAAVWLPAIAIGTASSLALLIAFFHPWLVLGVGIDLILLWASLVAGWTPAAVDSPV